jgi:hypothetical protein
LPRFECPAAAQQEHRRSQGNSPPKVAWIAWVSLEPNRPAPAPLGPNVTNRKCPLGLDFQSPGGSPGERFGRPGFTIVGLIDRPIREARARVKPAIATPASSSLRGASPRTSLLPSCPKKEPASTWRSCIAAPQRRRVGASSAAAAHEAAVAAFLASWDPARVAALEARWPVLSERQMERREQREIPCGDAADLEIVGSRTREGFAQPVH